MDVETKNIVLHIKVDDAVISSLVAPVETIKGAKSIGNMLEDIGDVNDGMEIPLDGTKITPRILPKLMVFLERLQTHPLTGTQPEPKDYAKKNRKNYIPEWEKEYLDEIAKDWELYKELLISSDYLEIKPLLSIACKYEANALEGKTTEEIRERYGIVNDFTEEEEAQIIKENDWVEK
jgi:hypothetical protein